MKRFLALLALIGLVSIGSASAAPLTGPQFLSVPIGAAQGNQYAIITNAMGTAAVNITFTGTYCTSGCTGTSATGQAPNVLIGIYSLSGSANTGTIKCSDVYSGALGSTIIAEGVTLGAGGSATAVVPIPIGGLILANGLTCQMSTAAAVADGILVVYR